MSPLCSGGGPNVLSYSTLLVTSDSNLLKNYGGIHTRGTPVDLLLPAALSGDGPI
jgi:hypothetical protein